MSAGSSAAAHAQALRTQARQGLWRRIQARLGIGAAIRRADAIAGRWERGAQAEAATARLLRPLEAQGWYVWHDRALPGSRANLDTVLVAPDGTVVVLDTKGWARNAVTALRGGRVCCGREDRHGQVEKVASYAIRIAKLLGVPQVVPVVLVHGSPVAGGYLAARVPGLPGPVYVLTPDNAVQILTAAPRYRNPARAAQVAAVAKELLPPYLGPARR
ncbi:nuclease-related domain-containing protein [Streptomyces sp. NPDC001205]